MKLAVMGNAGRAQREFPTLNQGAVPGDGPENIRFTDVVVIEPIARPGFIIVGAERPAAVRDGDPELPVDIAFAVQRSESEALTGGQILQRAGGGLKWRSLKEVDVDAAKHSIQPRDSLSNADARIGCVI